MVWYGVAGRRQYIFFVCFYQYVGENKTKRKEKGMTSLAVNYGMTPALVAKEQALHGQNVRITPRATYQATFGDTLVKDNAEQPKKSGLSTTTTVLASGFALAIAAGLYALTRGKIGVKGVDIKPAETISEKLLSDGRKFTREIVKNEDGTQTTIMKMLDKDGKLIKQKEKTIVRSENPVNGKKYVTMTQKYSTPRNPVAICHGNLVRNFSDNEVATTITNRYYGKSGKFETVEIRYADDRNQKYRRFIGVDGSSHGTITYNYLYSPAIRQVRMKPCMNNEGKLGFHEDHFSLHGTPKN